MKRSPVYPTIDLPTAVVPHGLTDKSAGTTNAPSEYEALARWLNMKAVILRSTPIIPLAHVQAIRGRILDEASLNFNFSKRQLMAKIFVLGFSKFCMLISTTSRN